MWTSQRSHTDPSIDSYPLCANETYYLQLDAKYPRPRIWRGVRWLLSHFVLDALGLLSLGYILLQDVATNFANEGPDMFSTKQLSHWFAWQLATHYPMPTAAILGFLLLLIPVGFWMKQDRQRENDALARQREGRHLAQGYRAYLTHVATKASSLPRLLQGDYRIMPSQPNERMIFAPLRLAQTTLAEVQRTPLDQQEENKSKKPKNRRDQHQTIRSLDSGIFRTPTMVVNRAIDALAHARNGAIVVLGRPGSGKTTLLRHLIWEQTQEQLQATRTQGRVPIFLDLAMPDVAVKGLKASITAEVESVVGVDSTVSKHIIAAILEGPSLVVVDGLDELLGNIRKSVLTHLETFALNTSQTQRTTSTTNISGNRQVPSPSAPSAITTSMQTASDRSVPVQIAVSSRISSFRQEDLGSRRFETWEVLPLTHLESQRQLVAEILNLQSMPDTSTVMPLTPDQLLARLEERPQTAGWATSPLLLTLATLDWSRSGGNRLARTRVALYRGAVEELMKQRMKDWSSQELSEAVWLAEEAALELFLQGRRLLTMHEFFELIMPRLPQSLTHRMWGPEKLGPGDVLLGLSGLFVLDLSGRYDIYHLTFLEYLAARALARRLMKQWQTAPVAPRVFLDELRVPGDPSQLGTDVAETGILKRLWLKRTVTRWSQVLMMMTGVLSEEPGPDKLMSTFHRPDLAQAWIRALLDQPKDVGLLGLRLAAGCAAELSAADGDSHSITQEITDRLVTQLRSAAGDDWETRKQTLRRACAMLAGGEIGQEKICNALLTQLTDSDEQVRQATAETIGALGVAGRTIFPKLVEQLADPDQYVRKAVSEAIQMLGGAGIDVLPLLASYLTDPNPDVRVAVIRTIGILRPDDASVLDILCDRLADKSENTSVCQAIAETIGSMELRGAPALNTLSTKLGDDNVNMAVREAIVEAISRIGAAGVDVLPNLLAYLTDSNWRIRVAIVQAIGKLGLNAVPALDALCARLADENEHMFVRRAVAWAIGTLGPIGLPALDTLCASLADEKESVDVRQAAAWAVGTFGSDAVSALDTLHAILADANSDAAVRREVAMTIGRIGIAGGDVLDYLVPHLLDSDPEIRAIVIQTVGTLGQAGVSALYILLDRLSDLSEAIDVRQAAAEAIGKIGAAGGDVLDYLVAHMEDSHPQIRAAVAQAIGPLGRAGVSTLPRLCMLLADTDASVRETAAGVIGKFGREAESALPALVLRLSDADEEVRAAAEWAIKSIGAAATSVQSVLADWLDTPDWRVKRAAAGIVKAFGSAGAVILPQIQEQFAKPDESAHVREAIAQTVGALGKAASGVLPMLLTWLSDAEWRVREAVKRSVRELGEAGVPVVDKLGYFLTDPALNTYVRVAVVETIEALVSAEGSISSELRELLPHLYELHTQSDDRHILQAVKDTIRAFRNGQEVEASFEMGIHPGQSRRPIRLANDETRSLAQLISRLGNEDWRIREAAVQAIDPEMVADSSIKAHLMEALADPEATVSDSAAVVLAKMYPEALNADLLEDLGKALKGYAQGIFLPFAQRSELTLYSALGPGARPFLDRVVELLGAEHWSVREMAARLLGVVRRVPYATSTVLMRLSIEDWSSAVRKAADEALEAILSLDEIDEIDDTGKPDEEP